MKKDKKKTHFVSIIIPCRNEEKYIGKCLDSIVLQNFPKAKMEVLVVNGASEDKTKEIVKEYTGRYPFIKLLENPKKFTPFGLNTGIKAAKGEVIVRMDAHAGYKKNYVLKCLNYLEKSGADNVGGIIKTLPAENTLSAKAIAFSLSHPFGVGSSYFRLGSKKPKLVDTVFGGCYKRKVFEKIGLYNEKLTRSQDIEFNKRLKKGGGKILLVPEITAFYYPQADFKKFLKHNFNDGIWTTYPLKFGIKIFSFRHLIPLLFVSFLSILIIFSFLFPVFLYLFLFTILVYFSAGFYFSIKTAKKNKDFSFLFLMPVSFACRHIGYGFGSFWGLVKLFVK